MVMQVVATGSATVTDLNDARVLVGQLKSTSSKIQTFDPNTNAYNPSWATSGGTPVTITPELTILGEGTNIIAAAKSITWYKDGTVINTATPPSGIALGTTGSLRYPMTINANIMGTGVNSLVILARIVWTDTRINADITTDAEIVFTKITNGQKGTSSVVAEVWAPNGTSIRNSQGTVTLQCDVYNGIDLVTSGATYQWYELVNGNWTALTNTHTGYNTKNLTLTAAQINGSGNFKCTATYSSKTFSDVITVNDFSDPITASVVVDEGAIFKNSEGNKTATCKVMQGTLGEIDTGGTTYEYRWYLNKADGTPYTDASWVDNGKTYKTGKTATVTADQVTGTANLSCEIWTKSTIAKVAIASTTLVDMNDVFASDKPMDNPTEGSLWYNTDEKKLYVYQGGKWEFVADGMSIGGRNLVRNSTFNLGEHRWKYGSGFADIDPETDKPNSRILKITKSGLSSDAWNQSYNEPIEVNADGVKELTVSFDFKTTDIAGITTGSSLFVVRTFDTTTGVSSADAVWEKTVLSKATAVQVSGQWTRYSFTIKPTSGKYIRVLPYLTRNGEVYFREIKLEYGTIETDWTPAPEDAEERLEDIEITLGNIADDNKITVLERSFIKEKLTEIIGYVIADDATTLPTAATLTTSGVGEVASLRTQAKNIGIPTDDTTYVALGTAYNELRAYLHTLSPKPWDASETNKETSITIVATDYRDWWLKYYQAADALAELISEWVGADTGGTNLARYTDFAKWKTGDWTAYGSNSKDPALINITLASQEVIPFIAVGSQNGLAANTTFGVQMGASTDPKEKKMSLIAGKKYTLSFLVAVHTNAYPDLRYTYVLNDGGTNQSLSTPDATTLEVYGSFTTPFALTVYQYKFTFTARDNCPTARLLIGSRTSKDFTGTTNYGLFYLSRIQLEEGNKRSAWSPSPLDLIDYTDSKDTSLRQDLRLTAALPTSITQDQYGITAYTSDPTKYARFDYRGLYIAGGAIQIDGGLSESQLNPNTASKLNASPNFMPNGHDNFAKFSIGEAISPVAKSSSVGTYHIDDTYYLTSGKSLKLQGTAATNNYAFLSTGTATYNIPVTTGKTYIASCYFYTDSASTVSAKMRARASNGGYYSTNEALTTLVKGSWVRHSLKFTATTAALNLAIYFDGANIPIWVDCLQLEEVADNATEPSQWTPAGYTTVSTYIDANGVYTGTVQANQISVAGGKLTDDQINGAATWNRQGTYIDESGIYTGHITFDQAEGGSLKLGEVYGNGQLQVWGDAQRVIGRIDDTGAYFPRLQGDEIIGDIVNKYMGATKTVYFDQTAGSDANDGTTWAKAKKNIKAYIDLLPKNLNGKTITLYFRNNITGGIEMTGFHNGNLQVSGDTSTTRYKVYGYCNINYCTDGKFLFQGFDVVYDATSTPDFTLCSAVHSDYAFFYSVKAYGNGGGKFGFWADHSNMKLGECHVYNVTDRGLYAVDLSKVYMENCRGAGVVAILASSGSIVTGVGTRWSGSLVRWNNGIIGAVSSTVGTGGYPWTLDVWTVDTAEGTPTQPAPPAKQTIAISATTGDNYSSQGFWTNDEVKQGNAGWGTRYGIWYFDFSAIKGKTVSSATITFYRNAGSGVYAARTAYIRSHPYGSRAARPASLSSSSYNGANGVNASIAIGQTVTVDITNLVNLNIAKGTDNSLGVFTTNSTDYMNLGITPTVHITYS